MSAWRFLAGSNLRSSYLQASSTIEMRCCQTVRYLFSYLQDVDVLALLAAAVCHDVEHRGTTNSFEVNTGSAIALRYKCVRL